MIRCVYAFNSQKKLRLRRHYVGTVQPEETAEAVMEAVVGRESSQSNFILLNRKSGVRAVYRKFATLCIAFVIDTSENSLATVDLIQVFVQVLDRYFKDVCELDVIFNFERVNFVLDELVIGGHAPDISVEASLSVLNAARIEGAIK